MFIYSRIMRKTRKHKKKLYLKFWRAMYILVIYWCNLSVFKNISNITIFMSYKNFNISCSSCNEIVHLVSKFAYLYGRLLIFWIEREYILKAFTFWYIILKKEDLDQFNIKRLNNIELVKEKKNSAASKDYERLSNVLRILQHSKYFHYLIIEKYTQLHLLNTLGSVRTTQMHFLKTSVVLLLIFQFSFSEKRLNDICRI